jgi:hypothetical protein
MTVVRIAQAQPRVRRHPNGNFRIDRCLVVLTDDVADRSLPVWLRMPGGIGLRQLLDRPAADWVQAGVLEETAARLLHAAGVRVTGVDIEPVKEEPAELDSDSVRARVGLATDAGARDVVVSAGYGLALAAAAGAPVQVPDDVMDRLAVPVRGDDLLAQLLPPFPLREPPRPLGQVVKPWRFEPRNLVFTDGLDHWELAGSFLEAGRPHWRDYACAAADRSAVLASAVAEPSGFAVLVQTIYADDYRGAAVTFRGQLRTTDVAGRAGLHLAVGPTEGPPGAHLHDRGGSSLTGPGSTDRTWHEVTLPVPPDAGVIRFGISLTGRGRIELRNAELTPARPETQQ